MRDSRLLMAILGSAVFAAATGAVFPAQAAAVQIPPGKICDAGSGDQDDDNNVCVIHVKLNGTTPSIKAKVFFNVPVNKHIVWKVTGNPDYGFKDDSIPIPASATGQFDMPCATDNKTTCPAPGGWHKFYHWHTVNPQPNKQHDYVVTLHSTDPAKAPIVVKIVVKIEGKDDSIKVDPTIVIQG